MLKYEAKKYMDLAESCMDKADKCSMWDGIRCYTEQAKVYVMMAAVAQGVPINAA